MDMMRSVKGWAMAIVAICIFVHTASAAPVISVEPANTDVSEGGTFTVNVMVDPDGVDVRGVQYKLQFDSTLLNATDQSKGAFLSHDGVSTMNMVKKINNTIGIIEYGETRTEGETGVTAPGILATITFNAIESGVCSLTLDDVVMSDPDATEIPDVSINGGRCTITSIETGIPTATEPPSTGMATPTAAESPTAAPIEPAVMPTATAAETAVASQTPPTEPRSTASPSATPKQTM
ncbi:MAG: cohesin domain-containing protein, partial [Euryarchaeota archaeon]|nr:cohesin domain-containing protein [Euryarchaeota archaeon]